MIELTRLNGKKFFLNAELIESLEASPDTTIRLTNGKMYVVQEDCRTVNEAIINYHRSVLRGKSVPVPPGWNVIDMGSRPTGDQQ